MIIREKQAFLSNDFSILTYLGWLIYDEIIKNKGLDVVIG